MQKSNGDWNEWSKFIILELERLSNAVEEMAKRVNEVDKDLAVFSTELKIKSGLWGVAGGLLVAIPLLIGIFNYFK